MTKPDLLNVRRSEQELPQRPWTQVVWWFPEWCGVGFSRWSGHPLAWLYHWSLLFGFFELRRWRAWDDALLRARAQDMDSTQGEHHDQDT